MGATAEELRQKLDDQRHDLGRDLEAIGDRVSPGRAVQRRRAAVGRSVNKVRTAVMGAADSAGSGVAGSASSLSSSVSDSASAIAGSVTDLPGTVRERTQGAPFAAGLVAFGAGLLAASLLPATDRERRAAERVEPALQQAAGELGAAGADAVAELKDHAADAAAELKDDAQDSLAAIKSEASDAVSKTADQAKEAAKKTNVSDGDGEIREPDNSTVDDWMGQRVDRDRDLAETLLRETGDANMAAARFEAEKEGPRPGDLPTEQRPANG